MLELIDLDLAARPVARVKLFGKAHDVLPLDGRSQRLVILMTETLLEPGKATKMQQAQHALATQERLDEIVAQVAPSLTTEERERLVLAQKMQVVQIAGQQIAAVKRAIVAVAEKNGSRSPRKKR